LRLFRRAELPEDPGGAATVSTWTIDNAVLGDDLKVIDFLSGLGLDFARTIFVAAAAVGCDALAPSTSYWGLTTLT
jgi:hypothetical protein